MAAHGRGIGSSRSRISARTPNQHRAHARAIQDRLNLNVPFRSAAPFAGHSGKPPYTLLSPFSTRRSRVPDRFDSGRGWRLVRQPGSCTITESIRDRSPRLSWFRRNPQARLDASCSRYFPNRSDNSNPKRRLFREGPSPHSRSLTIRIEPGQNRVDLGCDRAARLPNIVILCNHTIIMAIC